MTADALARPRLQTPDAARLWPLVWAAAIAGAVAAVAVAPLAAYVLMIGLFGLPHVLCEMRYCDERFSGRADRRALLGIFVALGFIAASRIAQSTGLILSSLSVPLELGLGAALCALAVFAMRRRRLIGAVVGLALGAGAVFAPIPTFLVFAWLHNLTPLGFIAELMEGRERTRTLLWLLVPFVAVPALVATGVVQDLTLSLFGHDSAAAPSAFGAGAKPLLAFLPATATFDMLPLFQAAVVAQVMHYVAVILYLPWLAATRGVTASARPLAPWPRWRTFYVVVGALALAVLASYWVAYGDSRAAYGVAAALHSWIEIPIFLIALGLGFRTVEEVRPRPMTAH